MKGFTLIELMIVIAIIAILAVVLIPNIMRAREASRLTACKSNIRNLLNCLEMYSNDYNGNYPGGPDTQITNAGNPYDNTNNPVGAATFRANYVDKFVRCPKTKSTNYLIKIVTTNRCYIYCPSAPRGPNLEPKHVIGSGKGGPVLDSGSSFIDDIQTSN